MRSNLNEFPLLIITVFDNFVHLLYYQKKCISVYWFDEILHFLFSADVFIIVNFPDVKIIT